MKRWLAAFFMSCLVGVPAHACQDYPCKTIRIIVPMEPGGGIDSFARVVASTLVDRLRAQVVVVNRGGAEGRLGTAWAATLPGDGYTLLVTGLNHISSALLNKRPGYDPIQDFEPIAKIAEAPNVLIINRKLPVDSVQDLVRLSREKPSAVTFSAVGGSTRIAAEIFLQKTNLHWLRIPYKGSAQALRATMAGETSLIFAAANLANPALETGTVKALAVTHPSRLAYLPDVPTMKEAGFSGVESMQWYGVFAPAKTPSRILDVLEDALRQEQGRDGALRQFIQSSHLEPAFMGRHDFKPFLLEQAKKIRELNIEIAD